MDTRKENLLKAIVDEYVATANPVGSSLIVEKYFPDLSSATVRNEMADLEEMELIGQPHTSAGRMPTIKGYQYYLDNFLAFEEIIDNHDETLEKIAQEFSFNDDSIKSLAKAMAEISDLALLVGFAPMNVYYTGISNLFRQPEFVQQNLLYSMSDVIDSLDEVMAKIFNQISGEPQVLLGEQNPFGEMSAVVLAKYIRQDREGIIGILGPTRMDYRQNLGLVKQAKRVIESLK